MLFAREDSVELAWSALTPVFEALEAGEGAPPETYAAGSDGPREAGRLMSGDVRTWRPL
jgi:glucose-6-phosphate 1-dehydrogenase